MAEAAHDARGEMNIDAQRGMFGGFLTASVWGCTHIIQAVALLTLAFAIGAGWWAGFAAYVVIGVAAGLIFRMGGAWWAAQIVQWVLLGAGGVIVPLIASLTS